MQASNGRGGLTTMTRDGIVTEVSTREQALHRAWDEAKAAYGLTDAIVIYFSLKPNKLAA
ncbi:hypothetical protein ACFVAV_11270 [Nocardia sp. NPDC057663]|uniref:hypothetical protein n=1 Tax=Nocardia sp. NPDC057663 TaxID=3346201 RepID=UPI0036702794